MRLWDVATHLARAGQAQPIFQLVLRAAHTRPRRHRFASNLLAPPNQSDCQSDCQSIEAAAGDHLGTLSGVSKITDTEEVTGSNPVSPSSIIPCQRPISLRSRTLVQVVCKITNRALPSGPVGPSLPRSGAT